MSGLEHHRHTSGPEHDFEPEHGLPQALPADEQLLWQGAPDFISLAQRVFHVRKLAVYFALMVMARAVSDAFTGAAIGDVALAAVKFGTLAAIGIALIFGLAWLTARTTVYTVTDRRVVMRIGIVLSVSYNLPLARVEGASLRLHADGTGNLPLALVQPSKIAYLHLWPHARPWRAARPEPMLLCVPDAARVAGLVSTAWARVHGKSLVNLVAPMPQAEASPRMPASVPMGRAIAESAVHSDMPSASTQWVPIRGHSLG